MSFLVWPDYIESKCRKFSISILSILLLPNTDNIDNISKFQIAYQLSMLSEYTINNINNGQQDGSVDCVIALHPAVQSSNPDSRSF